jgi:hypothetical protein
MKLPDSGLLPLVAANARAVLHSLSVVEHSCEDGQANTIWLTRDVKVVRLLKLGVDKRSAFRAQKAEIARFAMFSLDKEDRHFGGVCQVTRSRCQSLTFHERRRSFHDGRTPATEALSVRIAEYDVQLFPRVESVPQNFCGVSNLRSALFRNSPSLPLQAIEVSLDLEAIAALGSQFAPFSRAHVPMCRRTVL